LLGRVHCHKRTVCSCEATPSQTAESWLPLLQHPSGRLRVLGREPHGTLPSLQHWQIANNKRYAGNKGWTVSECAERVSKEIGNIDILVRVDSALSAAQGFLSLGPKHAQCAHQLTCRLKCPNLCDAMLQGPMHSPSNSHMCAHMHVNV